jgi:hypothetical protein
MVGWICVWATSHPTHIMFEMKIVYICGKCEGRLSLPGPAQVMGFTHKGCGGLMQQANSSGKRIPPKLRISTPPSADLKLRPKKSTRKNSTGKSIGRKAS